MPAVASPVALGRIVLSNPAPIALQGHGLGKPVTSWIQLAKTGSWISQKYGKFSITAKDLAQMLFNFQNVTPRSPTMLPVDYDHLSMAPQRPGDGAAAGWLQQLQLRDDGDTLWGLVTWTHDGARQIATGAYKFVSPSFVLDHVHTDGTKIGATLLAAAITNHPFLQGMSSLSLCLSERTTRGIGEVATPVAQATTPPKEIPMTRTKTLSLAEAGQRVAFGPDAALTPELDDADREGVYTITECIGAGDDQFCKLQAEDGRSLGWYRALQLMPADPADKATTAPAPLTEEIPDPRETGPAPAPMVAASVKAAPKAPASKAPALMALTADAATAQLMLLAATYSAEHAVPFATAVKQVASDPAHAALLAARDEREVEAAPSKAAVVSLSAEQGATSFLKLVEDVTRSQNLTSVREAVQVASALRPDLASHYQAYGV